MTHERLHQLLENPALLAGIPYEELKTLALSYPYAHNLRYLLAMKSNKEQRPDAQRTLTTASVYSLNRSRLFTLIAPQKIVQQEEVLELKPIEAIQKTLETRVPLVREVVEEEARQALQSSVPAPQEALPIQPAKEPFMEIPQEKVWSKLATVSVRPSFGVWISQFNPPNLAGSGQQAAVSNKQAVVHGPILDQEVVEDSRVEETSVHTSPPNHPAAPEPVDEEPEALGEDPVRPESEASKQAAAEANLAQRLAERSVQENKEIASETLARLYWRQGHKEKALAMYERLCLLFPEKSAYFAAEIDKLKK